MFFYCFGIDERQIEMPHKKFDVEVQHVNLDVKDGDYDWKDLSCGSEQYCLEKKWRYRI